MQCLGPTLWNALVAADSPAGLGRRLSLVGVGQLRRWIWSATHGEAGWASGPEGERGLARGPGPALLDALVGSCRRAIGVGTFGGNAEPAAARRPWRRETNSCRVAPPCRVGTASHSAPPKATGTALVFKGSLLFFILASSRLCVTLRLAFGRGGPKSAVALLARAPDAKAHQTLLPAPYHR